MSIHGCLWTWHGLPCALLSPHRSPHHIVGEQPAFAKIERAIEAEAATIAQARTAALEAFALRVSRMGPCSQTHHGWIVLDARAALAPQEPGQ